MEEEEMDGSHRTYEGEVHILFRVNMKGIDTMNTKQVVGY
jgi:hypothetical protein